MLEVTDRAAAALDGVLAVNKARPEDAIRLVVSGPGVASSARGVVSPCAVATWVAGSKVGTIAAAQVSPSPLQPAVQPSPLTVLISSARRGFAQRPPVTAATS